MSLDPNESDPLVLWAEIARLEAATKGPAGYASWQDAATAERVRRVKAEAAIGAEPPDYWPSAKVIVHEDEAKPNVHRVTATLYAPGLPPGEYDLYLPPSGHQAQAVASSPEPSLGHQTESDSSAVQRPVDGDRA